MAADDILFYSQNEKVVGKFFPANGEVTKTVLLLQGFPGNQEDVLGLGDRLSERGYNVLTFNYRGTFDSDGNYGLKNAQQDISAAYSFLSQSDIVKKYSIDTSNLILGGYSFGGGMALTYASNNNDIKRVFSIAGTDHGQFARDISNNKEFHEQFISIFESLQAPEGPVRYLKTDFTELLNNSDYYDLKLSAANLKDKDLLLFYGIDDPNVTLEDHGLPFYRSLKEVGADNLHIKILQDNHSFSNSMVEIVTTISTWLSNSDNRYSKPLTLYADLAQQWLRGVYGSDPAVVDDLAANDIVSSYPIFQKLFGKPLIRGSDAVKDFASGFCQRWKETEVTFHETVVQDNQVVLIWSFSGRKVGTVRSEIEPTNETHKWGGITLIRFDDEGKIVAEIGEESEPGPMGRVPVTGD